MSKSKGFTLVELMVTIAIIAFLTAFAVPMFSEMTTRSQLLATVNSFTDSISLARSEAVNQGRNTRLSAANDGWEEGWDCAVVLTNDPSGPEEPCRSVGSPNGNIDFEANTDTLAFSPAGTMNVGTEFRIEHSRLEDEPVFVCISMLGRITVDDQACRG